MYGIFKKIDLYDAFIDGCTDGLSMGITLFPNLLAMILSVNILINSGLIDYIMKMFKSPVVLPTELVTLIFSKPISGSASLSIMNNIFIKYGVDSLYGLMASAIQGSTDTTFYVIALYYGTIGIKNIRSALCTSLIGDVISISLSILLCKLLL